MGSPARVWSRPPFVRGYRQAVTHWVFACDASDEAKAVVGELLPTSDIERCPLVALIFAETWIRWRRAVADIETRGEMLGDGADAKPHPLLPHESRLRRDLLDLADRFGLDPKAEAGLAARDRAEAARPQTRSKRRQLCSSQTSADEPVGQASSGTSCVPNNRTAVVALGCISLQPSLRTNQVMAVRIDSGGIVSAAATHADSSTRKRVPSWWPGAVCCRSLHRLSHGGLRPLRIAGSRSFDRKRLHGFYRTSLVARVGGRCSAGVCTVCSSPKGRTIP